MRIQRLLILSLVVLASYAAAWTAGRFGGVTGVEQLELLALRFRQQATAESRRPGSGRESEVVLVFFDSASVDEWEYLSPFPRTVLAGLIDAMAGAGAKAIGLDVYLGSVYPGLNALDGGDDALHAAIERAGNVVLVAPPAFTEDAPHLGAVHPYFGDVAAEVAAADLPTPFETVTDGTLAIRDGRGLAPSFALALYARARGFDVDSLLADAWEQGALSLPALPDRYGEIPRGWRDGTAPPSEYILNFPLRFIGPPSHTGLMSDEERGTFSAYSASVAPLVATFTPDLFRDKIVLLGTSSHDSDKFRTPFHGYRDAGGSYDWMFGVEIHGNALQNMLDEQYVRPLGGGAELVLMLAIAALVGAGTFWKGAGLGGATAALTAVAVVVGAFWLWTGEAFVPGRTLYTFDQAFLAVPVVTPLLTVLLSYLGSVAYVAVVEGRDKRFLKGAFGQYVSPEVVDEIASNPGLLRLGGEKRTLTILFSDLAGFTDLSETLDPADLIALLNEYLSEMTRIVLDEGGTLDKYIGDAVMAFWNAPTRHPDHADRALRCAILMQRRMTHLNREWRERDPDHEDMVVRIGINTGEVVVGNVGGKEKFDYSAIGDAVNLAARLEPANKTYDTLIMASEFTVHAANEEDFRFRELDLIAVKGKVEPVRVFEVLEESKVQLPPRDREESLRYYGQGLEAYHRREWREAVRLFQKAVDSDPKDGPARLYLRRATEFVTDPPPDDWDFVERRTKK